MKTSTTFTIRRSSADDAPLFHSVIEQTMREFIIATWGRWDESRVVSNIGALRLAPNTPYNLKPNT